MAHKKVNDVIGVIKKITQAVEKEFEIKKGPKAGEKFHVVSIGIQLENEEWFNIKASTVDKANDYLWTSADKKAKFSVGQEVKIYLESEDEEGKYWRIVSMVPHGEMDEIEVIDMSDAKPIPVKQAVLPGAEPTLAKEEPVKDKVSVAKYKEADADKYEIGMAKQIAAELINKSPVEFSNITEVLKYYDEVVRLVYAQNKKLRIEILGY